MTKNSVLQYSCSAANTSAWQDMEYVWDEAWKIWEIHLDRREIIFARWLCSELNGLEIDSRE